MITGFQEAQPQTMTPTQQTIGSFSVLVPVYNDAPVLSKQLPGILEAAEGQGLPFEVLIAENGSTDATGPMAETFAQNHPAVRTLRLPEANYGRALQGGIAACRREAVVIFNIDFWSPEFLGEALKALREADLVIGSKTLRTDWDRRPILRRWITRSFNGFLRLFFGFQGTDTHGMKAFLREPVSTLAAACVTDHFIFDTELVLRIQRAGLRIREIPVPIREIRQIGYRNLIRRMPEVFRNLVRMQRALS
ncbi:MAG: glycosyl transferase family 2 [Candidatus Omnitrophica bacterium CG11_big_fil_rev_8_21_14_0_20_64_10]|nr:MAG: glycosyl transferase family 2 [Candidatus Omnitrophica bacterium CG11_big_fil_rev_8_21_14_0_20_64_10]